MALARGCSESASAVAATCSSFASSSPNDFPDANTAISVTAGLPSVSVPVLSKMMAWIFEACSNCYRCRCRQAERIWAGNDHRCHRQRERKESGLSDHEEPDQECQHSGADRCQN